jgi:hypothetical protein
VLFRRLLLTLALWPIVLAAAGSSARAELVLRDGDRVVLLGGTIVEREQLYGYWEAMFVSHFPRASVAFRNLGRSGDTVWGDSRAGSGTADDGFKALIEHVENIKPTLIIVAYGANESLDGEARLGRFQDGLKRLLDRLAATGARIMLLAPLRLEQMPPPLPDPAAQNKQLWHYVEALHDVAVGRDYPFLDFERWLAPLRQSEGKPFWTDDGVQLNRLGYWITSAALENDLELRPSGWKLELDGERQPLNLTGAKLAGLQRTPEKLTFELKSTSLPLTAPVRQPGHSGQLSVAGLKAGRHELSIDGRPVTEASADEWQQGVALDCPAELHQMEMLRRTIVKKNELYLHRWRPQHEADPTGRPRPSLEQNAAEAPSVDTLVAEPEAEIARLRVPLPHRYELIFQQPESQP